MLWARRIWLKLQGLLRRNRNSRHLDNEIQFHLDQQIAENLATGMSPEEARYATMRTFGNPTYLKEDLQTLSGVSSVGLSTMPILHGYGWTNPVIAEGYSADPGQDQPAILDEISPNLFTTLRVPIVAGRDSTPLETRPVTLINESFARKYFVPVAIQLAFISGWSTTARPRRTH